MSGVLPLLLLYIYMAWTGKTLIFTLALSKSTVRALNLTWVPSLIF
jgi:hypothetical protein